ncbi:MAG: rRNA maturation RNase YbeY, partial [Phycisphaerales bacterium]|nr:rRNA maturation RNase YbeY [Phycisphaerales bacterium]
PSPPLPPGGPVELELIDPLSLLNQSDHNNIYNWAAAVYSQLSATGSVRAKIVNDQQMSKAHKKFSNIDGTTDVLTFDLNPMNPSNNFEHKVLDTDLIICIDQATRQAELHNHSPAHELLLYIIHGTLHCLGYDDHTDKDFKTMHNKEDQLLTAAGIGPLFDRGTHS